MKRVLLVFTLLILVQLTNAQFYGDQTFNPTDVGYNSFSGPRSGSSAASVIAHAILPNGKILIGGLITSYNGEGYLNTSSVDCNLMRINADGSRDTTFNYGGIGASASVRAIAIQPDGKILIGGFFQKYNNITVNGICRLNSDGSFDPTFNSASGINSPIYGMGFIYSILVLPSGKILLGGAFRAYNLIALSDIALINSDGSIDTTFNSGGSGFTYHVNYSYNVSSLALQADGKILAGGYFTDYNGTPAKGFVRLNANGSLDNTFSAITSTFPSTALVTSLLIRPDGKTWITGKDISTNGGTNKTGIMLLAANGTIDPSFAVTSGAGLGYSINSLVPVSNNKILIGGNFISFNGSLTGSTKIARVNNDGSLDQSFALGNSVYTTGSIVSMSMQADSTILFSGSFTNTISGSNNSLEKLTKNHVLDLRFNEPTGAKARVKTFTVQPDSKIMIGGQFLAFNKVNRNRIARITFDGELDTTYAPFSGANGDVNSILVQSNGKILAAGAFTKFNDTITGKLIRTDALGNIDTAFLNKIGLGANNTINVMAFQADGKIIIGGDFGYFNGITANYLARLNTDGSFDNTFDIGSGGFGSVRDVVVQLDGKILVGGNFQFFGSSSSRGIVRLNSDGSIDASFLSGTGFRGLPVNDIELAPNGSIFVSVSNSTSGPDGYNGSTYTKPITKLKPNGTIDSSFYISGTLENVYSSNVLPNGNLLLVRSNSGTGDNTSSSTRTLNPSGTYITGSSSINGGRIDKMQIFENGRRILLCGDFTSISCGSSNVIGRNRIGRVVDPSIAAVLPLTLQTFTANLNNNDALLKWNTLNEANTDKFIVERSTNNNYFQTIGTVPSKGIGDSEYQIMDYGVNKLNSNVLYYRLKMQDKDGKTTYSPIVLMRLKTKTSISLSPNPTRGMATLQLQTSAAVEQLQINLYDLSGKLVLQQVNTISLGSTSLPLNLAQLQNGMYYLQVSSILRNETLKVIKQ
ncbi:MAG: T9SS type A sorting domain-containing protein [Chitinophagaceae bacterium]|jgi:uncharacterized delta-60 repeat protein